MYEPCSEEANQDSPEKVEDKQSSSPIDILRNRLKRYKRLSGDERKQFLKDQYSIREDDELPYYTNNKFLILIHDTESGNFFGYDPEEGTLDNEILQRCTKETGIDPLLVATDAFQTVVSGYTKLRRELGGHCKEKEDSRKGFPFRITKQHNFSVPLFGGGGELVGFGQDYLYSIAKALVSKDESLLKRTLTSMEAQFFHELLHQLSSEDNLDTHTVEEMALLGEFLYDPAGNLERNAVFLQMNDFILDEEGTKAAGKWSEEYDKPWKKVGVVILLSELIGQGLISGVNPDNLRTVLQKLPEYYAQVSKEQRMAILKKYITLNKTDLYKKCEEIAHKHNFTFAL